MRTKDLKNTKGITLVALVITIIVLLILAGVSLSLVVGEDGIISRTISAGETYKDSEIIETITLAYQDAIISQYLDKNITSSEIASSIQTTLENQYDNVSVTAIENDGGYTVEIGDDKYTVTDSGTTKNSSTEPVSVTVDLSDVTIEQTEDDSVTDGVAIIIKNLNSGLTPVSVVNADNPERAASKIKDNSDLYWDVTGITNGWDEVVNLKLTARDKRGNEGYKVFTFKPTCFVAGTKVLTPNGLKNIEDIEIGDTVMSMNMDNMQQEEKEVTNKFIHETRESIYNIYAGDEVIKATCAHLIYTKNKGWVPVCKLESGDILSDVENNDVEITNIIIEKDEEKKNVYNIEVKDNHTYFVGENNILVHNKKAPLP